MWSRFWAVGLATMVSAAGAPAETIRVRVDKLTFAPAAVSAHIGDTIEWVNVDFIAHTATTRHDTVGRGHSGKKNGSRHTEKRGGFRVLLPVSPQHGGPDYGP